MLFECNLAVSDNGMVTAVMPHVESNSKKAAARGAPVRGRCAIMSFHVMDALNLHGCYAMIYEDMYVC